MKAAELTFRVYVGLLWKRFWADVRSDLRSAFIGLFVALAIVYFQYQFDLLPWNQTPRTVLTRVLPYGLLILGYVLYHGLRASWKLQKDQIEESENEALELARYGESLILKKDAEIADLRQALELPNIVPKILSVTMEDVEKADFPGGLLGGLVGKTDVRVTLQVRVSNGGRVPATVERCELRIDGYREGIHRGEFEDRNALNQIDLRGPIEFGVPRTGYINFMVRNTSVRSLVREYAVIVITDGTDRSTEDRAILH